MNHRLGILSSGVNFALHLVHFMTNFELQLQKTRQFFSNFWLQLVRMKSSKKACPRFLITFLLFEILANITFLFPLKSVLKTENSFIRNFHTFIHFLRNHRHRFSQRLFPHMHTTVKGILPEIFWIRAQTLYAYRESSKKTYTFSLLL